jgi:hypothetical protein
VPDGVAIKQGIELVGGFMGPVQEDAVQRADILLLYENLLAPRLIVNLDWIRPGRHGGGQAGRQTAVLCDLKRPPSSFVRQALLENRLVFVVEGVTWERPGTGLHPDARQVVRIEFRGRFELGCGRCRGSHAREHKNAPERQAREENGSHS